MLACLGSVVSSANAGMMYMLNMYKGAWATPYPSAPYPIPSTFVLDHNFDVLFSRMMRFYCNLHALYLEGYPAALMRIVSKTPQALSCSTARWGSNLKREMKTKRKRSVCQAFTKAKCELPEGNEGLCGFSGIYSLGQRNGACANTSSSVYTKLPPSPVILWIELDGKPKWLPMEFWIPWRNAYTPQWLMSLTS